MSERAEKIRTAQAAIAEILQKLEVDLGELVEGVDILQQETTTIAGERELKRTPKIVLGRVAGIGWVVA